MGLSKLGSVWSFFSCGCVCLMLLYMRSSMGFVLIWVVWGDFPCGCLCFILFLMKSLMGFVWIQLCVQNFHVSVFDATFSVILESKSHGVEGFGLGFLPKGQSKNWCWLWFLGFLIDPWIGFFPFPLLCLSFSIINWLKKGKDFEPWLPLTFLMYAKVKLFFFYTSCWKGVSSENILFHFFWDKNFSKKKGI